MGIGDVVFVEYFDGFLKNIECFFECGWCVELYGWVYNIFFVWCDEFEIKWVDFFKIIELDEFCEEFFDMIVEFIFDFKLVF